MVVKQWLREYLSWTSSSADPSEVVVLRQVRAEALKKWQVPAIIGGIPAFLEFALILFLCGGVLVLWTLDHIVAIVFTIFTSIFLIAAVVVTVLPTFRHECPYKSPLGWAFVLLWNRTIQMLPRWALTHTHRLDLYRHADMSAKTWIRRDMYRMTGAARLQAKRGGQSGQIAAEFAAEVLVTMAQALAWVREDSERTDVLDSVDRCMRTIHETTSKLVNPSAPPSLDRKEQMVDRLNSALLATNKLLKLDESKLRAALGDTYFMASLMHGSGKTGRALAVKYVQRHKGDSLTRLLEPIVRGTDNLPSRVPHVVEEHEILNAIRILISALGHAAEYMFLQAACRGIPLPQWNPAPTNEGPASESAAPCLALNCGPVHWPLLHEHEQKFFIDILCLVETIIVLRGDSGEHVAEYVDVLVKIFAQLRDNPALDDQYPGLRTMIFEALCTTGNPERVLSGWLNAREGLLSSGKIVRRRYAVITALNSLAGGLDLRSLAERANRYAVLANRIYDDAVKIYGKEPKARDEEAVFNRAEDRHKFVIIADHAFQHCDHLDPELFRELLSRATEAALDGCAESWTNCGCYSSLPWVDTLLQKVMQLQLNLPWDSLSRLLDGLEQNASRRLIFGQEVRSKFVQLQARRQEFSWQPQTNAARDLISAGLVQQRQRVPSTTSSRQFVQSMERLKKTHIGYPDLPVTSTPAYSTPNQQAGSFYGRQARRRPASMRSTGTLPSIPDYHRPPVWSHNLLSMSSGNESDESIVTPPTLPLDGPQGAMPESLPIHTRPPDNPPTSEHAQAASANAPSKDDAEASLRENSTNDRRTGSLHAQTQNNVALVKPPTSDASAVVLWVAGSQRPSDDTLEAAGPSNGVVLRTSPPAPGDSSLNGDVILFPSAGTPFRSLSI